jgi:DNA-binding MarR family transcriptional regulator
MRQIAQGTPEKEEGSPFGRELYRRFLAFNRRLVFLMRHLTLPLTVNESYLLADVALAPGLTPGESCRRLRIPKGTLSRVVRSLAARRLLTVHTDAGDRRLQRLWITVRGRRTLAADIAVRNREMDLCVETLSPSERTELVQRLGEAADGLGAPPLASAFSEDPLLIAIRRLTKVLAIQGGDCMGTGQPVLVCQALHLLQGAHEPVPFRALLRLLPCEAADLSRLLHRLARSGRLRKAVSPADRRQSQVILTPDGEDFASLLERRAALRLDRASAAVNTHAQARLLDLLQRFLETPVSVGDTERGGDWRYALLPDGGRAAARAFLWEALTRTGERDPLPAWILAPPHLCAAAYDRGRLAGVAELRQEDACLHVIHLAFWPVPTSGEPARRLLGFTLRAHPGPFAQLALPARFCERLFPQGAPWRTPGGQATLPAPIALHAFPAKEA